MLLNWRGPNLAGHHIDINRCGGLFLFLVTGMVFVYSTHSNDRFYVGVGMDIALAISIKNIIKCAERQKEGMLYEKSNFW